MENVSKALDGHTTEAGEMMHANPKCICAHPMAPTFCPYGHMLECHYPHTCEEAGCSHYQRAMEEEEEGGF
jgi:hypothetical protein